MTHRGKQRGGNTCAKGRSLGAIAAIAVLWIGCAGPLSSAKEQFRAGRYPEAKQTLEAAEHAPFTETEQLEYEVYRGLVHHALGDKLRAAQWLTRADIHDRAAPGLLKAEDRMRLHVALQALKEAP